MQVIIMMGSSRVGMGLALLLWSFSLSWLLCDANGHFESSSLLHCALDKMELSFSMPIEGATSSLKVLGKSFLKKILLSFLTYCGLRVGIAKSRDAVPTN